MISNKYSINGDIVEIVVNANEYCNETIVKMDLDIFNELNDIYDDKWTIDQRLIRKYKKISACGTGYCKKGTPIFPLKPVYRNDLINVRYLDGDNANLTLANIIPSHRRQIIYRKKEHVEIPVSSKHTGRITIFLDNEQYDILEPYGSIGIRMTRGSKFPWISVGTGEHLKKATPLLFTKKYNKPIDYKNGNRYDLRKCNIVTTKSLLPFEPASNDVFPNPLIETEEVLVSQKLYKYTKPMMANRRNVIKSSFYYVHDNKLVFIFSTQDIPKAIVAGRIFKQRVLNGVDYFPIENMNMLLEQAMVERIKYRHKECIADKIENGVATIPLIKRYITGEIKTVVLTLDEEDYLKYREQTASYIRLGKSTVDGIACQQPRVMLQNGKFITLRKFLFGTHTKTKDGNALNLCRSNIITKRAMSQ